MNELFDDEETTLEISMTEEEWCETANALHTKIMLAKRGEYDDLAELGGDPDQFLADLEAAYEKITEALEYAEIPY